MRSAPVLLALTAGFVAGCGALLGLDDHDPPLAVVDEPEAGGGELPEAAASLDASMPDTSKVGVDAASLPECAAQRLVHVASGNGGFGWFTLIWPLPLLVTDPQPTDAYDDLSKVAAVAGSSAEHPLYARKVGARTVLEGVGAHPDPTAFVAGHNETHTQQPMSTDVLSAGTEIVAAAVIAQQSLAPKVPIIQWAPAGPYGPASGAPATPLAVSSLDGAITALQAAAGLTAAEAASLRIDDATLTTWGVTAATTPSTLTFFAQELFFAARAFELGVLGSIILPAFGDNPDNAFADVASVTLKTDILAQILEGFYRELGKANETACSHHGQLLSLADNVVLFINGDTPHNSFTRNGWPDGTSADSNLIYVRSNGWLLPGWFGSVSATDRTDFDPRTGSALPAPSTPAGVTNSTNAALGGLLYAVTRGDKTFVGDIGPGPYTASVAPSAP